MEKIKVVSIGLKWRESCYFLPSLAPKKKRKKELGYGKCFGKKKVIPNNIKWQENWSKIIFAFGDHLPPPLNKIDFVTN